MSFSSSTLYYMRICVRVFFPDRQRNYIILSVLLRVIKVHWEKITIEGFSLLLGKYSTSNRNRGMKKKQRETEKMPVKWCNRKIGKKMNIAGGKWTVENDEKRNRFFVYVVQHRDGVFAFHLRWIDIFSFRMPLFQYMHHRICLIGFLNFFSESKFEEYLIRKQSNKKRKKNIHETVSILMEINI